jgi:hypothetical protein
MTYGIEPRRKRSSASSRRDESLDEAYEADNWLAGLRPGQDGRGEPDPFAVDPFAPDPYEPPARRRREAHDDATTAYRLPSDESPTRGGRRRVRDEEPTDYGMAPAAGNGYPPANEGYVARRARDDERSAAPRDQVPELTPIMKPLSAMQPQYAPTEPPPLTPIFPALGPPQPSVGKRRRSEPEPPPMPLPMPPPMPEVPIQPPRRAYEDNGYSNGMDTSGDIRRPRPRPAPAMPPAPREPQGYADPGYADPAYADPAYADPTPAPPRGRRGFPDEVAYTQPPPPARPAYEPRQAPVWTEFTGEQRRDYTGEYRRGSTGEIRMDRPIERPVDRALDRSAEYRRDRSGEFAALDRADGLANGNRSGEFTNGFASGGGLRTAPPPGRGRARDPIIDPVRVGGPGGPEKQHRPHRWIAALSVIGVLVLVAACGLGTYFMVNDERKGPAQANTGATQGPKQRDISSRKADAAALSEVEVFPNKQIVTDQNDPPYQVLKTQIAADCTVAAADDLGKLLVQQGCNQVVRATMKSPTGDYLITAGLFNLTDQTSAETAFNGVKPIIDAQKGRFVGMSVGPNTGTDAIVRAPTQLGWNFRGHFIAYCVIARTDGQAFASSDDTPNQITLDIVETYLEGTIIGKRATVADTPAPGASAGK